MPQRGGYDYLRRIDRFAEPVTLRLDRKHNFPTPVGGLITVIVSLLLFAFVIDQLAT